MRVRLAMASWMVSCWLASTTLGDDAAIGEDAALEIAEDTLESVMILEISVNLQWIRGRRASQILCGVPIL